MYGFTVGGGLDVALTSNIFLRGEFEYVRFAPLADMTVFGDVGPSRRRHQVLVVQF